MAPRVGPPVGDDRLQLIYDAGSKTLAQQDTTLGNLRNRTTALFTAAGLATSFSAGIGLINTNEAQGRVFPAWAAWVLLGLLAAIGVLSIYVLWPVKNFAFGPDSSIMFSHYEAGESKDELLKFVIVEMNKAQPDNDERIHHRMQAFQLGGVLLLAEICVLVIALAVH
jgi:hypothetical protein